MDISKGQKRIDLMPEIRTKDLPSLTGLRFFAALMVLIHHAGISGGVPLLEGWRGFGTTGVSFFFVLSGFVLTWGSTPSKGLLTFYAYRIFRIWPLMLTTLALALPVFYTLKHIPYDWRAILLSAFALQSWFTNSSVYYGGNPVAWSLSNEAFFYLLHPFISKWTRNRKTLAVVALIVATCVIQQILVTKVASRIGDVRVWFVYIFPAFRAFEFFLGVLGAILMKRYVKSSSSIFNVQFAILAVICWFYVYYSAAPSFDYPARSIVYSAHFTVTPLLYLFVIMAAARSDIDGLKTFFARPALITLGHWSFALYMVHSIIIYGAVALFGARTPSNENLLWYAVLIIFSVVCSGLLYEFIEKPANQHLRNMWARRQRLTQKTLPIQVES